MSIGRLRCRWPDRVSKVQVMMVLEGQEDDHVPTYFLQRRRVIFASPVSAVQLALSGQASGSGRNMPVLFNMPHT